MSRRWSAASLVAWDADGPDAGSRAVDPVKESRDLPVQRPKHLALRLLRWIEIAKPLVDARCFGSQSPPGVVSDASRVVGSDALDSCRSRGTACRSAGPQLCAPTDGRWATARSKASGNASPDECTTASDWPQSAPQRASPERVLASAASTYRVSYRVSGVLPRPPSAALPTPSTDRDRPTPRHRASFPSGVRRAPHKQVGATCS